MIDHLRHGEAGRFEVPGQAHHILTIHAAGRIGQEIACDGPSHRRELTPGDTDLIPAGAAPRLADEAPSEVLAIEAGLGATMFKAASRSTFASPVHRHLVRRRAERARLLLLEGDLPASQVALEAGFTHQTHMARWLRRLFGVLPSDLARAAPIDRVSPPRRTLLDQSH